LFLQISLGETSSIRVLSKRNLEVVFLGKKSLSDVRFFREKGRSLSVAPEPLAVWNKKLEGLENSEPKNEKYLLRICTLQPPSLYPGSFFRKNSNIGSFYNMLR
jgi:hypothetical protein